MFNKQRLIESKPFNSTNFSDALKYVIPSLYFEEDNAKNQKLFDVAQECGIKKENIQFTCMESKSVFLKNKGFIFHIDDDDIELMDIFESKDSCRAIHVDHFEWKETCQDILKKNLAQ